MEHNVFSKAVDSAHQSYDSVSSWFNTLTTSIRENIILKDNKSQHGNCSSPQRLVKERRTSEPACSFYHVDTTYSNAGFRHSQNSFRGNNFKPGITNCLSLSQSSNQASANGEPIKIEQMDSSTNSKIDLMNGHPVEECGILLTKDSLPNICSLISTASDNSLNVTNDDNWLNTGSSNVEDNMSNRNKIRHIRDTRTDTSCNNTSVYLTAGRTNALSVSNPEVQRRRNLRVDEVETTIHNFRQRSRTYGSYDQRLSVYKDLRKIDLQSPTSSNDNKRIVPLKGNHTNIFSRRVSICSDTRVNTLHIVSKDNDVNDAYSDNYSVYVEHVLNSRIEIEEHITPIEDNEASICSQFNIIISGDQPVRPEVSNQSVTGSLKICVQHFETTKTLRVIVLTASNLNAKKGHIYPRLTVHYGIAKKKSKTVKLPKEKANTLVVFNTAGFFENIDGEKIEELILKVRLYHKKGVFKFKKCLGELVIPVYKYNLSMDTNIKGKLKQKNSQNISDTFDDCRNDDEDIEVLSDDRSISAKVGEAVKPGSRYSGTGMRHGTRLNLN